MRLINADKLKEDKTMCRKIMIAMTCVIAMGVFNAVPVSACTPPLNPPSVEIPDINFQPDGALEDAINNAVKTGLRNASSLLRWWIMHRITRAHRGVLTTVT